MSQVALYRGQAAESVSVGDDGATFTNIGPDTVYYGDQNVSSTVNTGSIAAGAAVTLTGSPYLVLAPSATRAYVNVASHPASSGGSGVILPWVTATAYKAGQPVTNGGRTYLAVDAHTSGAAFDAAHWSLLPTANQYQATAGQAIAPVQTFDAFMTDRLQLAQQFIQWCSDNGVQGHIGEIGWPNNSPYSTITENPYRWNALAAAVLQAFLDAGMWVSAYHADTGNDHDLRGIYTVPTGSPAMVPLSQANTQAAVIEGLWVPPGGKVGVGWAGSSSPIFAAGFSNAGLPAGWSFSQSAPMVAHGNTYGNPTRMNGPSSHGYSYGEAGSFGYLASRPNVGHIRLECLWELMQPTLNGALNATEMARIDAAIALAGAAGLGVILDVHNFGQYFDSVTGQKAIGTAQVPVAAFADLWQRLSARYASNANVIAYDLMNEPGGAGLNWTGSSGGAQAAVTAIRGNGDNKLLLIELNSGSLPVASMTWAGQGITDPASNFRFSAHYYFDSTSGGGNSTYSQSYAALLASAQAKKAQAGVLLKQAQPVAAPSGGGTVDVQARVTLGQIVTLLEQASVIPTRLQAVDTFVRPDATGQLGTSSDGHPYINSGWSIVSNQARPVGASKQWMITQAADGQVQATFTLSSGNSEVGVMFRAVDTSALMYATLKASGGTSTIALNRSVPGLGSAAIDQVSGGLTPGSTYTIVVKFAGPMSYMTVYAGTGTGGSVVAQLSAQSYATELTMLRPATGHGLISLGGEDGGSACTAFQVTTLDFTEVGTNGLALPPLGAYAGQSRANALLAPYTVAAANPKELVGWWDASQLGLADTTAIDAFPGIYGPTLRQATSSARPLFRTAIQNSLGIARLASANSQTLASTRGNTDGVQEIYGVLRRSAATFTGFEGAVGALDYQGLLGNGNGTTRWVSGPFTGYYNDLTATNNVSTLPAPVNNIFGFFCLTYTANQGNTGTAWATLLGSDRNIGGRYWDGDIAEIIEYSVPRSAASRLAVLTYLKSKWGL